MTVHELVNAVTSGNLDSQLRRLHGDGELEYLRRRAQLISAAENFSRLYPMRNDVRVFFAPKTPEIQLNFGGIRISAASEVPEADVAVIADFHGEPMISVAAGELDGTLVLGSCETTGRLCNVLLDLYAEFPDILGFDMVIGSDAAMTEEEIGCALRAVAMVRHGPYDDRISRFFAGYSLCVTRVAEVPEIPESTPPDMTADEFYDELPELMSTMNERDVVGISRYFEEKRCSDLIGEAVGCGDIAEFFRLADQRYADQPRVETALHLSRRLLSGEGASVAENGCVLAFVPTYAARKYAEKMGECFGECSILNVGGIAAVEII